MADWQITAYLTADGHRFHRTGDDMWQGPNGVTYTSTAGLAQARGPLRAAEVVGLPDLVAELELTAEVADRLHAQLYDAGQKERATAHALRLVRRALEGAPRRCAYHGTDFETGCTACNQPHAVTRALAAIDAAARQPEPAATG